MNENHQAHHDKKQDTAELPPLNPEILGVLNPELNFYHATDGILTLKTIGCHIRWKNRSIINHCTDKFVFHYVLSGKGFFNGHPFDTENVLYCNSNTPYTISPDIHEGCVYAYFTFSGGKSLKYISKLGIHEPFKIYKPQNFAEIAGIFYELIKAPHEEIENDFYLESIFLRILSYSKPEETTDEKQATNIYSNRIETAIQYIAKNYDNANLRIADIADYCEVNEQYLNKQFKKEVGMALYQYITNTRMNAAVSLLTSSNYNTNQISDYVGYNDHQAFHTIFKKRFGISPTQFKKSKLNED